MPHSVSKLVAFVLANGDVADEILFRDLDDQGEVPGLSPEERDAMIRAEPLLREAWIGILSACREAFWKLSVGHAVEGAVRSQKTQPNKMFDNGGFQFPLVPGRASAGMTMEAWGEPEYHLHVWCWTQARQRKAAEMAVAGLQPQPWRSETGSFVLSLPAPKEGETYEAVAARAAPVLWGLARPIADALLGSGGGDPA